MEEPIGLIVSYLKDPIISLKVTTCVKPIADICFWPFSTYKADLLPVKPVLWRRRSEKLLTI